MRFRNMAVLASAISILAAAAGAADMGRQPIGPSGTAAVRPGQVQNGYSASIGDMGPGIEAAVDWSSVNWKVAGNANHDSAWSPDVSFFYGISPYLDLRLNAKYMSLKDQDDMDVFRFGVGARAWLPTQWEVLPYAGVGLNYYRPSGSGLGSPEGALGISGEAGVAYLISERAAVRFGLQAEATVADAKATINGQKENISLSAAGLGVGIIVAF